MLRFNGKEKVNCPIADAFLMEVFSLGRRYGVCISHEDKKGGFIIKKYNDEDVAWLNQASISEDITPKQKGK